MKAKVVFKPYNQHQLSLFPLDLNQMIPENHAVRLLSDVVDLFDISDVLATYQGGGTSSYHPRMLLKVLLWAYFNNIYSSRKIARALESDIYFMWLSGMQRPDFRTIAKFRSGRLKKRIEEYFVEVTKLLNEFGVISLQEISYLDGTKIEANANRYSFVWGKRVKHSKEKLEQRIKSVLSYINQQIKLEESENSQQIDLSEIDVKGLKSRVKELNQKLQENKQLPKREKKKLQTKLKHVEQKDIPKLEEYEEHLKKLDSRNSYSKTDVDATFMRMKEDHMRNSQLKPGYNVQISTQNQFIVHYTIGQTSADTTLLPVHIDAFALRYGFYPKQLVADAGYSSLENYKFLESRGIDSVIKPQNYEQKRKKKFKRQLGRVENMYYNRDKDYFVCAMGQHLEFEKEYFRVSSNGYRRKVRVYKAQNCQGCPLRSQCYKGKGRVKRIEVSLQMLHYIKEQEQKLSQPYYKELYAQRKIEPESVFGNIKQNKHFRRFMLRGLDKVTVEFGLIAIVHNLAKLYEIVKNDWHRWKAFVAIMKQKASQKARQLCFSFFNRIIFPPKKNFAYTFVL